MSARFPNVPAFPGVPQVFRNASNPPTGGLSSAAGGIRDGAPPLVGDQDIVVTAQTAWGIYTPDGELALATDSIFRLEPMREFRISDYPVEEGGFQTYNKVAMPGETRVTVTKGGKASVRQAFLNALDALIESTDLVTILTPDESFLDRNLVRYDYVRDADSGATLLVLDLLFIEVRQTAQTEYTTTKKPSGADRTQDGPVQPQAAQVGQSPAGPAV